MNARMLRMRLFRTRVVLMVLALPFLAALGARSAASQARGMPAPLLKRLGEAVDGYRTGQPVFVVANSRPPYLVLGVFPDSTAAVNGAKHGGAGFSVYGPFFAPQDLVNKDVVFILGGGHGPISYPACDNVCDTVTAVAQRDIAQITIVIQTKGGPEIRSTFMPGEVDAVFFTLSSLDKFAMPYYTRLWGVDAAAQLRASYVRGVARVVGH